MRTYLGQCHAIMVVLLLTGPTLGGTVWDFETDPIGQIPQGWKVEATIRVSDSEDPVARSKAPLGAWKVIQDPTAPSGKNVLSLTSIDYKFEQIFNLCWTNQISFLDGEIQVRMKYNTKGVIDQGGGIMWRVLDKNNYYVVRYNPMEAQGKGFCLYYVKNAVRTELKKVTTLATSATAWHTIRITHKGTTIEGYLNGARLFTATDATLKGAGGVGVWTKADATTSFDDVTVTGASTGTVPKPRGRAYGATKGYRVTFPFEFVCNSGQPQLGLNGRLSCGPVTSPVPVLQQVTSSVPGARRNSQD